MPTFGQKNEDGTWQIDGVNYGRAGVAGSSPVEPGQSLPIVWGDPIGFRQPLAINSFEINYGRSPFFVPYYNDWLRRGARGHYYLPELDDPGDPDTSVIIDGEVPEEKESGSIVRTFDGRRIIADGNDLREESEETGETIAGPTDLGGEILNMHVDENGNRRSIVYTLDVVVDCNDAYDAAYNLAQDDEDSLAYSLGQTACDTNPGDFPTALANQLPIYLADPSRAVPAEWSTCAAQWSAGLEDGMEDPFLEGWEDRGCS